MLLALRCEKLIIGVMEVGFGSGVELDFNHVIILGLWGCNHGISFSSSSFLRDSNDLPRLDMFSAII